MNERIEETLEKLRRIDFFSSVGRGVSVPIGMFEVVRIESWNKAIAVRGSVEASNAFLEGCGRLTRQLSSAFRTQYRQWNAIARDNRELMETQLFPEIDRRIRSISELPSINGGQQFVKDSVRWDLLHFAAEQAYSEFVSPAFYSTIVEVYEAGLFPCKWDRVWPRGTIWVF